MNHDIHSDIPSHMALVPTRRKRGRPPKYRPEFCASVIEMGKTGWSKAEMAAELGISRETLYAWEREHPEFSDALKRAHVLAQAWWEARGRAGMMAGKKFNAAAWIFTMKNRFRADYAERVETTHTLDASSAFVQLLQAVSPNSRAKLTVIDGGKSP